MLNKLRSHRLLRRPKLLDSKALGFAFDVSLLLGLGLLLCMWLNFRTPLPVPEEELYLLSLEVPIAFGLMALAQHFKVRLRWWFFAIVTVLAVLLRLFMTADNISHRFLYRDFRVPLDLHLVPEFFRLLYDTNPTRALAGYSALFALFLITSSVLVWFSLWAVYRSAQRPRFRRLVTGLAIATSAIVAYQELAEGPALYTRSFSYRVGRELKNYSRLPKEREKILKQIVDVGERIGNGTHLDKLQGNHVLFVFIESYGRTVFVKPPLRERLIPVYEQMQRNLEAEGFHVVSDFLTSPTYGGFSWFAHQTLDTGVKVISHLHSQLLDEQKPLALADRVRDAGYLPILVMPGTTRPWPGMDDYYGFRTHYFSWEFGYRGPKYGWSPMADQFVLDRIYHEQIAKAKQPLFIQYALVSSHAPFNDIPRYVEDWSTIKNGHVMHEAGRDAFPITWEDPTFIDDGYAAGIKYEMRMMEGYLTNYVQDDTLVIFVGDHQPNQQVTGSENLTWSVPIHIACRNPDFIAPFLRRGYIRGMIPNQPLPHVGMERFMEEFLSDFSTEPLAVDPGIWPPVARRLHQTEAKVQ
jgi:hypothetical protein